MIYKNTLGLKSAFGNFIFQFIITNLGENALVNIKNKINIYKEEGG